MSAAESGRPPGNPLREYIADRLGDGADPRDIAMELFGSDADRASWDRRRGHVPEAAEPDKEAGS